MHSSLAFIFIAWILNLRNKLVVNLARSSSDITYLRVVDACDDGVCGDGEDKGCVGGSTSLI